MAQPTNSILVDQDVFQFLQKHATPLIDSPNDVLRRLLLGAESELPRRKEAAMPATAAILTQPVSAEGFVNAVLRQKFGVGFRRVPPYRMMFESPNALVYFQNFNKETDHLWYRVNENPWHELSATRKEAWVCLTNPTERFAYVVPVTAIQAHVARSKWSRPYLEINIDPALSRWTEFDWRLDEYLEHF